MIPYPNYGHAPINPCHCDQKNSKYNPNPSTSEGGPFKYRVRAVDGGLDCTGQDDSPLNHTKLQPLESLYRSKQGRGAADTASL